MTDFSLVVPSSDLSYDPWVRWRHWQLPGRGRAEGGSRCFWDVRRRKRRRKHEAWWGANGRRSDCSLMNSYICLISFFLFFLISLHLILWVIWPGYLLPLFPFSLSLPLSLSALSGLCPQWTSLCGGRARGQLMPSSGCSWLGSSSLTLGLSSMGHCRVLIKGWPWMLRLQ